MKKTHCLMALFLLLYSCSLHAQTWQWGKSGGTASDISSGSGYLWDDEAVYDMGTDQNGNVYAVSCVHSSGSTRLDNHSIPNFITPGYTMNNLIITSYSCSGALRWYKVIGGGGDCSVKSLRVDTMGHVYVMGNVPAVGSPYPPIKFASDTTLPYNSYQRMFVVQYDTAGNFKWLRRPDADTINPANHNWQSESYDMDIDGAGNLNIIVFLTRGALAGTPCAITANGLYILKYNSQGTVLSAVRPAGFNIAPYVSADPNFNDRPLVDFYSFRMAHLPNGNWIIVGSQSPYSVTSDFTINGQVVNNPGFVAGFNSQWQHIWHFIPDTNQVSFGGRPTGDAAGNIYLTGDAGNDVHLFGSTLHTQGYGAPFAAKLTANGSLQWLSNASSNEIAAGGCPAATFSGGIVLTPGGEVIFTGGCGGLKWGNYQIAGKCNAGYNVFVARLDAATGAVHALDSIKKESGNGSFGITVALGKGNSVYVGGKSGSTQYAGNDTMYYIGGQEDFFVAKYGYSCTCASPVSSFTKAAAARTVTLTYNGTTAGTDSVKWTYGDGQQITKSGSAITTPVVHSYAANGTYTVCATAYNSCGSGQVCQNIPVNAAGISGAGLPAGISAYPNPAEDFLVINGAANAKASIINTIGQLMHTEAITADHQTISISGLPAGVYMLKLSLSGGAQSSIRFVKE